MTIDRDRHRRSLRLAGYDYTHVGAYFVTICAYERACRLGRVEDGRVVLSDEGRLVEACWRRLPRHFVGIELDACVVMPNHLHGVIIIGGSAALEGTDEWLAGDELGGPSTHGTRPGSLGAIVQNFKSVSTRRVNQMNGTHGSPLWQRNYYERVIRNERELNNVREYIEVNPSRWQFDEENPDNRETKHSRHRRP